MKQQKKKKTGPLSLNRRGDLWIVFLAVIYTAVSLIAFSGKYKFITVLFCLAGAVILISKTNGGRLRERFSFPVAALAAYMLFVAISVAWASAGKFFLREYSKLLIAFAVYLFALLCLKKTKNNIRTFVAALSVVSALYALLSVDMASLQIIRPLLYLIPDYKLIDTSFEAGTRLTGIFGSGNTLAGVLALGIILNLYLLETAENKAKRAFAAVLITFSAYSFLLSFSLGATGFFALSAIVYLVLAGQKRGNVLLHMIFTAVPTFIFVFVAFGFFEAQGAMLALPLIFMVLNAAVCVLLELLVYPKLSVYLDEKKSVVGWLLAVIVLIIAVYGTASLLVTDSYSLAAGAAFSRSVYPKAGAYTMNTDYSGDLNVDVTSQGSYDVMKHTRTTLYNGPAANVSFTVPAGSRVIYIAFNTASGAEVKKAVLSDGTQVKLKYRLLPDFISNRLQGFLANENMIQRTVFFADGMKLFRHDPIIGNGMGSFESLICGYQDFYYETKYAHNNYVQVLLDDGIIGFAAYIAVLMGTLILLIKGRKKDGEFRMIWPMLASAFVMICCHSYMEVVMSALVYLPFAMSVFALIALCYGGNLNVVSTSQVAVSHTKNRAGELKTQATEVSNRRAAFGITKDRVDNSKKRQIHAAQTAGTASRWCSASIMFVYPVLILLNLYANSLVDHNLDSLPNLYKSLTTAIHMDCFEYNDYTLSAVTNYPYYKSPLYKGFVDKCADNLLDTPSNSIHLGLINYYMQMQQPDKAIEAAKKGIEFNDANPKLWNEYFAAFYSFATSKDGNPFLGQNKDVLVKGVKDLYSLMSDYNKRLWEPIVLDSTSQALIDYVNSL